MQSLVPDVALGGFIEIFIELLVGLFKGFVFFGKLFYFAVQIGNPALKHLGLTDTHKPVLVVGAIDVVVFHGVLLQVVPLVVVLDLQVFDFLLQLVPPLLLLFQQILQTVLFLLQNRLVLVKLSYLVLNVLLVGLLVALQLLSQLVDLDVYLMQQSVQLLSLSNQLDNLLLSVFQIRDLLSQQLLQVFLLQQSFSQQLVLLLLVLPLQLSSQLAHFVLVGLFLGNQLGVPLVDLDQS